MNDQEPLLQIRFSGEAVGPGRIPVSHLMRFLTNMNKALQRTSRVLLGWRAFLLGGKQSMGTEAPFEIGGRTQKLRSCAI